MTRRASRGSQKRTSTQRERLHVLERCLLLRRLDRCLRRRQPRDRNPVRRARHVIQPEAMAQLDARRIAAMLAANADLQTLVRLPPELDSNSHQLADADWVQLRERVLLID